MVRESFKRPRGPTWSQVLLAFVQKSILLLISPTSQRAWTLLIGIIVGTATLINVWIHLGGQNNNGSDYPCHTPESPLVQPVTSPHYQEKPSLSAATATYATSNHHNNHNMNDACEREYQRLTANRTEGLTREDFQRAWTYKGNRQRLARLAHQLNSLQNKQESSSRRTAPIQVVVTGGSISLGHGVASNLRYSDRLEAWLNDKFPLPQQKRHRVFNKGSHGADVSIIYRSKSIVLGILFFSHNVLIMATVHVHSGINHLHTKQQQLLLSQFTYIIYIL